MAFVEQKSIDDIELEHKAKEPVRSWPYDMVRVRKEIVEHSQLSDNINKVVLVRAVNDSVNHKEQGETHNHH